MRERKFKSIVKDEPKLLIRPLNAWLDKLPVPFSRKYMPMCPICYGHLVMTEYEVRRKRKGSGNDTMYYLCTCCGTAYTCTGDSPSAK